ncbi:MAG TPA: hypothetical protein VLQ65_03950 [Saliniramus sp.]|nr:hypothetical protein [Saliniramus sp.]
MDRRTNRDIASFPHIVETQADEGVASVIGVLQEQLALAREGKLRSVAVVTLSADGADIGTSWSCMKGDTAALVGKLTVLTHDMMSSRR